MASTSPLRPMVGSWSGGYADSPDVTYTGTLSCDRTRTRRPRLSNELLNYLNFGRQSVLMIIQRNGGLDALFRFNTDRAYAFG
jgi:hypothetical protein